MILSFEKYIKEHFGAISIEYPPDHMNNNMVGRKPLSIGSNAVQPSGRIPLHWNSSPYLSGGYSGSGQGRFGSDPDEGVSSNKSEADVLMDDTLKAHTVSRDLNGEYSNVLSYIDNLYHNTEFKSTFDSLEDDMLFIDIEVDTYPTPGMRSTDWEQPDDDGEPGTYKLYFSKMCEDMFTSLGLSQAVKSKLYTVDAYEMLRNFVIYETKVLGSRGGTYSKMALNIMHKLEAIESTYEESFDRHDGTYDGNAEEIELEALESCFGSDYDIPTEECGTALKTILSVGVALMLSKGKTPNKISTPTRALVKKRIEMVKGLTNMLDIKGTDKDILRMYI